MSLIDNVLTAALKNAWQNKNQDKPFVMRPALISGKDGVLGYLQLPFELIPTPTMDRQYTMYTLGQLSPYAFGVTDLDSQWKTLSEVSEKESMIIDLYVNNKRICLSTSYIMRNQYRNTIIAIDYEDNRHAIDQPEMLMMKVYSNAWLAGMAGTINRGIEVVGGRIETLMDASHILNSYNNSRAENSGNSNVFLHHNGYFVTELAMSDIAIGDTIEFVTDFTGRGFFDVKVSDLQQFQSTKDGIMKLVLQQPDRDGETEDAFSGGVDFYDDLVIMVFTTIRTSPVDVKRGIRFNYEYSSDLRQLTHRDYSISAKRISDIVQEHEEFMPYTEAYLRIFLRHARENPSVPDDGNLIKDLYLFNREKRLKYMLGTFANIDEWRAASLESSAYQEWADLDVSEIHIDKLNHVYSFHGLNRLLERPAFFGGSYHMPVIMKDGGSVYQYDSAGLLKGIVHQDSWADIYPLPAGVTHIETFPGNPVSHGAEMDSYMGDTEVLVGDYAEQYYYKDITGFWNIGIEGTDFKYDFDARTITWFAHRIGMIKIKRSSGLFYSRDIVIPSTTITSKMPIFPPGMGPLVPKPNGRLDIWMGDEGSMRRLVSGVDYLYQYPNFRILNAAYYDTDTVKLHLLYHGLEEDAGVIKNGFIEHRLVNYNNTYDIAFNRQVNITIDGLFADNRDVAFSERRETVLDSKFREGAPYEVRTPMNHIPQIDLTRLAVSRSEAATKDAEIEAFLSAQEPEGVINTPIVIPHQHELVSTLMHALVEDILSGKLVIDTFAISDLGAANNTAPYLHLLSSDPTTLGLDRTYITYAGTGRKIRVALTNQQHAFLGKVNTLYLKGLINLNYYFMIA